jgi:GNAT superfamily N-acetyltransferase
MFCHERMSSEQTTLTFNRFLDPLAPLYCLIAEAENGIAGFATYVFHLSTFAPQTKCCLEDLFIAVDFRNKGIGRDLVRAVECSATEKGATTLYWQTHESNSVARHLYQSFAEYRGFIIYTSSLKCAGLNEIEPTK